MKGYEKLEQHLIHQGKVVGFYEDIVKLPSGKVVTWAVSYTHLTLPTIA